MTSLQNIQILKFLYFILFLLTADKETGTIFLHNFDNLPERMYQKENITISVIDFKTLRHISGYVLTFVY